MVLEGKHRTDAWCFVSKYYMGGAMEYKLKSVMTCLLPPEITMKVTKEYKERTDTNSLTGLTATTSGKSHYDFMEALRTIITYFIWLSTLSSCIRFSPAVM